SGFTVSRASPVGVETKINVSFTNGTTSADDFDHTPVQVSYPAGSTTAQGLLVATTSDATVEADETFTAHLALDTPLTGGRLSDTIGRASCRERGDDTARDRTADE